MAEPPQQIACPMHGSLLAAVQPFPAHVQCNAEEFTLRTNWENVCTCTCMQADASITSLATRCTVFIALSLLALPGHALCYPSNGLLHVFFSRYPVTLFPI